VIKGQTELNFIALVRAVKNNRQQSEPPYW